MRFCSMYMVVIEMLSIIILFYVVISIVIVSHFVSTDDSSAIRHMCQPFLLHHNPIVLNVVR